MNLTYPTIPVYRPTPRKGRWPATPAILFVAALAGLGWWALYEFVSVFWESL